MRENTINVFLKEDKKEIEFKNFHHFISKLTLTIIFDCLISSDKEMINEMATLYQEINESFYSSMYIYYFLGYSKLYDIFPIIKKFNNSKEKLNKCIEKIINNQLTKINNKEIESDNSNLKLLNVMLTGTNEFSNKEIFDEIMTFLVK
jgi:cytochrome P450